jgi:phosphatidylserine decarboxylase
MKFSLLPQNVDAPVEKITPGSLPDANEQTTGDALESIVNNTAQEADVTQGIHATVRSTSKIPFIHKLVPGLENLANKYHVGNYVAIRGGDEKFFESMPIYARIGMHLLFYGKEQVHLLEGNKTIEKKLREQSVNQGKIYDAPASVKNIESFVHTYNLQTDELLEPDLTKYKTFNEFFYRKLKPDARPVQNPEDPAQISSAADCRLVVYPSIDLAKKFWVKGDEFTLPKLLNVEPGSATAKAFEGSALAIFRLAPADYHRFHSPIDAEIGDFVHVPGNYYTVNPQAVNEVDFDVFTANTRSVLNLKHTQTGLPVAFVAIGALLVGSIVFTKGAEKGSTVKKGEELGYFAYGGSTVIAVFSPGVIEFDADLLKNSEERVIETLMKVGYSLGKTPASR